MSAQLTFRGSLRGVSHGVGKQSGKDYTMLTFDTVQGEDLKLKADGHVEVAAEQMRRDLDWVLEVSPRVYQGNTSLTVVHIHGGVNGGKSAKS